MQYPELRLFGLAGIPEVRPGDNLASIIAQAATAQGTPLEDGDVVVVAQKVVSKAEGRILDLAQVEPSEFARTLAAPWGKDPRHVEVVLRESRRIVKMDRGVIITETHHGLVCANAGVDASNVPGDTCVALLPVDPDASAQRLRDGLKRHAGKTVAVLISDTFGRPWREGTTNVAVGVAGINPLRDDRGQRDPYGYLLQASLAAIADELAGAAELLMDKTRGIPVAVVRGLRYQTDPDASQALIREASLDMFR